MSKKAGGSEPSIWYSRSAVPTALGIAAQLGWLDTAFNGTGVTLGSLQQSTDSNILAAHVDHHLFNVLRQGGSVPAIWARSQGADKRVVGLTWTDEFQVLLALRESGIKTARDLRGRRLGLPLRTQERTCARCRSGAPAGRRAIVAVDIGGNPDTRWRSNMRHRDH